MFLSLLFYLSFYLLFILIFFKIIDTELDIKENLQEAVFYERNPPKKIVVTKTFGYLLFDIS